MIVCLCEGMSCRDLRKAVQNGCTTVPDLVRRTRAGSHCAQCKCDLKRIVEEERPRESRSDDEAVIAK